MMPRLEPWIETYKGHKFYFLEPEKSNIDIRDIAHSLAYTCRFGGHTNKFYSVAEHSVLVSYLALDPLAGLMHDASEAYIADIASPIKDYLVNYREMEYNIMSAIHKQFGITVTDEEDIKDCDAVQLKTEATYLLPSKGLAWKDQYPTKRKHGIRPYCFTPEEAEKAFLQRYDEVRNDVLYLDKTNFRLRSTPIDKYLDSQNCMELRTGSAQLTDCLGQNHCGQASGNDF